MNLYRPDASWHRENNTSTRYVSGDPLAVIYNEGFWRLHNVSPLYNLQYDMVKLKQYALKIRQALVSAVASNTTVKYVVKVEEQVNLKYSEDDANGLIINVSTTQDSNNKSKTTYTAILLSWGLSINLDNATHLPYMLESGEQRIGTAVKATLQTIFDCNIKQYWFTQQQLLQLGFNFVQNDSSRSTDPFSLIYRTPQVDHKDKVTLSFELGDIYMIWNGIQQEVQNNTELVTLTYQFLQNQIFCMTDLDITVLELFDVQLPRAEVKSDGLVKMRTPELVNCVFSILNDINLRQLSNDGASTSGTLSSADE